MTNSIIRCKDCRWWDEDGVCVNKHFKDRNDDKYPQQVQILTANIYASSDDPTREAFCYTGTNFGCVHGEKKEESTNADN
jgi:hypothetical protein